MSFLWNKSKNEKTTIRSYYFSVLEQARSSRESLHSAPLLADSSTYIAPAPEEVEEEKTVLDEEVSKIVDILYSRDRQITIEKDMRELLDDIEAVSKKLEIGLIDEDEATSSISKIKEKMDSLKAEKEALIDEKLPLETIMVERKLWKDRLSKLEEMKSSGKTSESVYQKIKAEYKEKAAPIEEKFQKEAIKATETLTHLQNDVKEGNESIESLKIRQELGEISLNEYKEQKAALIEIVEKKKIATKTFQAILKQA
ncbi:MAG: hypothetical protein ACFFDT_23900 [Candidatus Hodarchaeota archaeon]